MWGGKASEGGPHGSCEVHLPTYAWFITERTYLTCRHTERRCINVNDIEALACRYHIVVDQLVDMQVLRRIGSASGLAFNTIKAQKDTLRFGRKDMRSKPESDELR